MFFPSLLAVLTFFSLLPSLFAVVAAAAHSHRNVAKARRAFDLGPQHIQTFLDTHNELRAEHNALPLTWSPTLADKAAFWANLCGLEYSNGLLLDRPYGESLVAATGKFTIQDAIWTWAASRNKYNPRTSFSQYTQILWKETTQVGCAVSRCAGILDRPVTLYVCLYDPAGNIVGELSQNVEY